MATDRREANIIHYYRVHKNLSQRELADEMSKVFPWIDKSLISKMENGQCEPTEEMRAWCCNGTNSPADEQNGEGWESGRSQYFGSEKAYFSPLEQAVLDRLEMTDIDHRYTRGMLKTLLGSNDRQIRKAIETLRANGIRIGSGLGAKGYWIIRDRGEYKRFIKEYSSRAYSVLANKSAMDNQEMEGQIRL